MRYRAWVVAATCSLSLAFTGKHCPSRSTLSPSGSLSVTSYGTLGFPIQVAAPWSRSSTRNVTTTSDSLTSIVGARTLPVIPLLHSSRVTRAVKDVVLDESASSGSGTQVAVTPSLPSPPGHRAIATAAPISASKSAPPTNHHRNGLPPDAHWQRPYAAPYGRVHARPSAWSGSAPASAWVISHSSCVRTYVRVDWPHDDAHGRRPPRLRAPVAGPAAAGAGAARSGRPRRACRPRARPGVRPCQPGAARAGVLAAR